MATETATVLDVTARLAEARPIMRLFGKFDSRGLDAYDQVAAMLFDCLDQPAENWVWAMAWTVRQLEELRDASVGRWLDAIEGAKIEADIAALAVTYH